MEKRRLRGVGESRKAERRVMKRLVAGTMAVLCMGVCAEEHRRHHEHGKSVIVAEAVQRTMGLKTVGVEKRRIASTVALTGRFEMSPDARFTVATPVAGKLALKVKPLQRVKSGDLLFTVEAPGLVARAREIAVLENRLKVYRDIGTPNAALESELAVKRAEREALLAKAEEKDGVVSVRTSEAGQVDSLPVQDGAWLEAGAAAVQVLRPNAIRFKALVAASDAARLKDGMKATVSGDVGEVRLGVGNEFGIIPVYVTFDSAGTGRAGDRGTATCVTDESETPVAAVPNAAIVKLGLQPVVFVRDEDERSRFLALPIEPGISGGGWTAVKGLPDDDDLEIVVEGAYELKLAVSASGAGPAGHFHADGTFHEGADE